MPAVLDQIEPYLASLRDGSRPVELPSCPLVTDQYDPDPDCQVGVSHLLLKPRFVLGDITGFGKTPQALVAYGFLKWQEPSTRLLVLTRLSALHQWRNNVRKFLHGQRVEILGYGPGDTAIGKDGRAAQVARWAAGDLDILISTYHSPALDWSTVPDIPAGADKNTKRRAKRARAFTFPELPALLVTVFDESQQFRGVGTAIYPMVQGLVARSRYAWPLTATQLHTKLDDLYYLYDALRPGMLGTKPRFDARYYTRVLIKIGTKRVWKITGTKNLWDLMDRIQPYYLRREVVKRPGIRFKVLLPALGVEQRKLYTEILKQYLPAARDTGYKTAGRLADRTSDDRAAPLPKSTALTYAQFAVDAPEVLGFPQIPSAKMAELVRFLTEEAAGQKVLIYSRYEQVVTAISTRLASEGIPAVRITGKETAKQRDAAQTAFQTDPGCLAMVLNSAGGEALDLQAAGIVLFYDLPWSFGEFTQVLGRARRKGSVHVSVLIVLLGTQKTIDQRSLTILQHREQLLDDTFTLNLTDPRLRSLSFTDTFSDSCTAPCSGGHSEVSQEVGASPPTSSFVADLFDALQQDLP